MRLLFTKLFSAGFKGVNSFIGYSASTYRSDETNLSEQIEVPTRTLGMRLNRLPNLTERLARQPGRSKDFRKNDEHTAVMTATPSRSPKASYDPLCTY